MKMSFSRIGVTVCTVLLFLTAGTVLLSFCSGGRGAFSTQRYVLETADSASTQYVALSSAGEQLRAEAQRYLAATEKRLGAAYQSGFYRSAVEQSLQRIVQMPEDVRTADSGEALCLASLFPEAPANELSAANNFLAEIAFEDTEQKTAFYLPAADFSCGCGNPLNRIVRFSPDRLTPISSQGWLFARREMNFQTALPTLLFALLLLSAALCRPLSVPWSGFWFDLFGAFAEGVRMIADRSTKAFSFVFQTAFRQNANEYLLVKKSVLLRN